MLGLAWRASEPPVTDDLLGPVRFAADAFHGFAAEGGARLGLGPIRGARLGAAVVVALLAAALALAAFDVSGAAAAALAPIVLLSSPRPVADALLATPDLLGALCWLLALGAFARSLAAPSRLRRTHAGLWAGLFAGLAAAARPDLWVLAPLLALHWGVGRVHLAWLAHRAPPPAAPPERAPAPRAAAAEDWAARLRRVPTGVAAALVAVPALVALAWPWLAADPLHRAWPALAAAHGLGRPFPGGGPDPVRLLALALPAPLLLLLAAGVLHTLLRLGAGVRQGDGAAVRVEALLLLAALAPLALGAAGLAPRLEGLRPVLHALPILALLGARALVSLARTAWPRRWKLVLLVLAHVVLLPGFRTQVRAFPAGAAAWGEPVGGAPGAAALGLPRQEGGEGARGVLDALSRHAAPSARVLWLGVPPGAVARYRQAGLVRADLADAAGPADADLLVVARGAGSRDDEYQAWAALGTSRAVATAAFDEVPLAQVFARAGAWR